MFSYIYDWLSVMYAPELGDYLWGFNCGTQQCTDPEHHTFYGLWMLGTSIAFAAIYYFAINSPRFNHRWHSVAGFYYAPQAGLSFLLPHDAQLKAIVSRGFRNPTIRELYMYAPANDSLRAVSMWNYELAYKQYFLNGRLHLGANVFYLHAQNNIETRMVDGKPRNMNTGELRNAGFEIEFSGRVWKGLMIGANYSYLYMQNPVVAAPEHKLNVSVGYHHDRFRVGTSAQYIAGLYTAVGAAEQKEDFVLWNAHAAYRIWKGLWANIQADNLLGTEYEINAGFPMPRTTVDRKSVVQA
mgnify:CR=1 FL=1